MCLGLSRHHWRPLPLKLEIISLEWLQRDKKSETNVVMWRASLGEGGLSIGVGGSGVVVPV